MDFVNGRLIRVEKKHVYVYGTTDSRIPKMALLRDASAIASSRDSSSLPPSPSPVSASPAAPGRTSTDPDFSMSVDLSLQQTWACHKGSPVQIPRNARTALLLICPCFLVSIVFEHRLATRCIDADKKKPTE